MKFGPQIVAFLALTASVQAESLLIPSLADGWQPLAKSSVKSLPAAAPDRQQIVEPAPGQHFLFFEKAPPPKPTKASTSKVAVPPTPLTRVYYSKDPTNFGIEETNADALRLITTFPVIEARVVRQGNEWFIAGRQPDSTEIRVAKLKWAALPEAQAVRSRKPGSAIHVALYDDSGSAGKGIPSVYEQLGRCNDVKVTKVNAEGIRAGLTGYDVVIFTGGSGSRQANTIGLLGREQIRRFVEAGGGYVGICAGAYLACDGFSWGVKVLDAKTPSPKWQRGGANLEIEASIEGQKSLGLPEKSTVRYQNGPVLVPANNPAIPDFEPLVYFRTETAKNGSPAGLQINTPAIARGTFGKGRVLACSPHPEQTAGMETWAEHAVRSVAPR